MAYEKKDGDISVFLNDKGGNNKRPDYKGNALIGGEEYEVALWAKTSKDGKSFLSGSIKKAEKKEQPKEKKQADGWDKPFDDSIPF